MEDGQTGSILHPVMALVEQAFKQQTGTAPILDSAMVVFSVSQTTPPL